MAFAIRSVCQSPCNPPPRMRGTRMKRGRSLLFAAISGWSQGCSAVNITLRYLPGSATKLKGQRCR